MIKRNVVDQTPESGVVYATLLMLQPKGNIYVREYKKRMDSEIDAETPVLGLASTEGRGTLATVLVPVQTHASVIVFRVHLLMMLYY